MNVDAVLPTLMAWSLAAQMGVVLGSVPSGWGDLAWLERQCLTVLGVSTSWDDAFPTRVVGIPKDTPVL